MKAIYLLVIYLSVVLGCYKYCNGHGSCGPKDKCECYLGWGGADCSLRACPYGEALVDIPLGDLDHNGVVNASVVKTEWRPKYGLSENLRGYVTKSRAHRYAECSNSGKCNREKGECECYNGYEGSACQRRSCPTSVEGVSCSGNGVCMSSTAYAKEQGSSYYGWELDKFFTCKCDAGYEGVDCSLRQCPMGLDPITYAGSTMTYTLEKAHTDELADISKVKDGYYLQITYDGTVYPTPIISKLDKTNMCSQTGSNPVVLDTTLANTYQEEMKRAIQTIPPLRQSSVKISCTAKEEVKIVIDVQSSEPLKFSESKLNAHKTDGGELFSGSPAKVEGKIYDPAGKTVTDLKDNQKLCAGRGLCDSKTGLCTCFQGYYGYACENQRTIQL